MSLFASAEGFSAIFVLSGGTGRDPLNLQEDYMGKFPSLRAQAWEAGTQYRCIILGIL